MLQIDLADDDRPCHQAGTYQCLETVVVKREEKDKINKSLRQNKGKKMPTLANAAFQSIGPLGQCFL